MKELKKSPWAAQPEKNELSETTQLLHDEPYSKGAVSPPIYQSSLFSFNSYSEFMQRYRGENDHPLYSRVDNPTVKVFQDKMAALECADDAVAFSSGMAAISSAILSEVKAGDKIVSARHIYPDAYRFIRGLCERFGIESEFVDSTNLAELESHLTDANVLYLESPSSWIMEESDIESIAALAKRYGVTTIIDNSWATPLFQKPLLCGIDIVIHSASKYISGHSDVVAGVVISDQQRINHIKSQILPYLGGKLSAHEAALLTRGLRTLPLRLERHQNSALSIAQRLQKRPEVTSLHHPGINQQSFSKLSGYSSLFSIEVGEHVDVGAFCDALTVFQLGVSWGGYESLVLPAEPSTQQIAEHNPSVDFKVPTKLIRLYVGLEDPEDLWNDLLNALTLTYLGKNNDA